MSIVVASNRGPFRFDVESDGALGAHPAPGGLASALRPLLTDTDALWVAAPITEGDRLAARSEITSPGLDLHLLDLDPREQRLHYDVVSNQVLWFLHHRMFDLSHRPRFDARFREAWDAYVTVNHRFADAITQRAPADAVVLVQDIHLAITPALVLANRPDVRVVHFTHTPFAGPDAFRVLPDDVGAEIVNGMRAVPCGFHTDRWASAYVHSVRAISNETAPSFVAPLGPDADALERAAATSEAIAVGARLEEHVGDRALILRSDRIEPSKNVVRGFLAYDRLLEVHPAWRERVVFVAFVYGSRESLPEYLAYRNEIEQAAARVNDRWATNDWEPVVLDARDDHARTVAGLGRYDVLLVNPISDGLNLVAKEGPILNRRDGVLCLSREAGAFAELGDAALPVHPYDLEQTAHTLHRALTMDGDERRARAARLREQSAARSPSTWLAEQLEVGRRAHR